MRRWQFDTRLNRESFDDASLAPGDCLSVGPIEIEVLSTGWVPLPDDHEKETIASFDLSGTNGSTASDEQRLAAERRELEHRAEDLRQREEALEAQKKQLDAESVRLEREQNDLESERRQMERREQEFAQTSKMQADELEMERTRLQAELEAFEEQCVRWKTEQGEQQRLLEEQRKQLESARADLTADGIAITQAGSQCVEAEVPPIEETSVASVEMSSPTTSFLAGELADPEFREPESRAPVDLAAVLQRTGLHLPDSEEEEVLSEPATRLAHEEPDVRPLDSGFGSSLSAAERLPRPASQEGDEESIDDYMNRLMQRVRGTTGGSIVKAALPTKNSTEAAASQAKDDEVAGTLSRIKMLAEPSSPMVSETVEQGSSTPRSPAPENRTDLSALRELANLSAHHAISRHARRVLVTTIWSKLLVMGVALAAAGGLLWMWHELAVWEATFYAALVAILVAVCWGANYAMLLRRLLGKHWLHRPVSSSTEHIFRAGEAENEVASSTAAAVLDDAGSGRGADFMEAEGGNIQGSSANTAISAEFAGGIRAIDNFGLNKTQ